VLVKDRQIMNAEATRTMKVNTVLAQLKGTSSRMILQACLILTILSDSIIIGGSTHQYFLREPADVRATLGEQVRLPCAVKNKTGECQWTKDGFGLGTDPDLSGFSRYTLDLSSSNSCDLILDPVQHEDEGLYQCQVGAVPGVAAITSKPVTLIVNHEPGLPHILQTKHGDVMEVTEGEEIVVECESQGGKPAADIVWKHKDGTKVASEVVDIVTRMDDEKLFKTYSILKFVPEKDEEIVCTAFSDQYRAARKSNGLKIRLKYKPRIDLEFSDENVQEGGNLEAVCKADAYPMNMVYKWFINDVEMLGENKKELKMKNIQRENDQMEIKCRAENEIGFSEQRKVIELSLAPKIVKHPETTFGRPDEIVTFSCTAEGNPPPRYIWVRSETNELAGVGQNLTLTVSETTEGNYACKAIAEDHQPETSDTARLVMKRKPRIETETIKTGVRGKDVLLNCRVKNAFPGTEVVWANKDQPLDIFSKKFKVVESRNSTKQEISTDLIITKLEDEDFKQYGCFASNELGTDYQTIELEDQTSHSNLAITLVVNIIGGLVIFIILVILWFRRRRSNVEFMEEHKRRNSPYLNNQEIYKNSDKGVFDKLLNKNELVVKNDNFNINMEFEAEEGDPEYEERIPESIKNLRGKQNISLSPNDSVASSRTVLSFLEDSP